MTLQEARRLLRSLAMLSPGQMAFDREKATRIVTQLVELLEERETSPGTAPAAGS
jgi:hypothetical protein